MTPLERAARDRITRYLAARDKYAAHARALGANPEHVPGDAIDNQADTAEVLPIPGPGGLLGGHLFPRPGSASFPLRERDLRLLLAALDERENDGEPLSAGEPHQVTMRLASDGFPFPHDTQHPAACDLLRYGQHCQFDQLLDEGHAFPDAPGVFTARIVLAREPEPGDVYTEEPEIHYERTEDA